MKNDQLQTFVYSLGIDPRKWTEFLNFKEFLKNLNWNIYLSTSVVEPYLQLMFKYCNIHVLKNSLVIKAKFHIIVGKCYSVVSKLVNLD